MKYLRKFNESITTTRTCDSCGKNFRSDHDYTMHNQESGGYALNFLVKNIEDANSEEEKIEELCDHFLHTNPTWFKYDEELIRCAINGLRTNKINIESDSDYEEDWYGSNHEIADFVESNIPKIKEEFNRRVQEVIEEKKQEVRSWENRLL